MALPLPAAGAGMNEQPQPWPEDSFFRIAIDHVAANQRAHGLPWGPGLYGVLAGAAATGAKQTEGRVSATPHEAEVLLLLDLCIYLSVHHPEYWVAMARSRLADVRGPGLERTAATILQAWPLEVPPDPDVREVP